MSTILITIADPAHQPVKAMVEELDQYLLPLYPAESNHLLDIETLRQPEMRFFAAFRGEDVIAIGGCWLHDGYAEVKRIYVTPAARGLGLAKQIMQRIEEEAIISGRMIARLETGIHQPESLGLYRRLGFVECGAFGDYPADDPNSVFMEKRLGP
ncbi:GNAT family N-acetyltransferase [Aestuariivirga sp.]|uniref:GNAT family N-acetyltransferase n=1 Tax=Aestuariivirga sp. TaxID=2650926 RepID=UPI003BAA6BCF